MYINPISQITPFMDIAKQANINEQNTGINTFKDMFAELVNNVNQTDAIAKQDIVKIAQGSADDLHTITINSEKAELATLMLVQVRNKVLDAYNEIMRITI